MAVKIITPTWGNVKTKLTNFDRVNLLALVQGFSYRVGDDVDYLFSKYGLGD
jgi:hypothetical protein